MSYFPVEIKSYAASVGKDASKIELRGDVPVEGLGAAPGNVIPNHLWGILFFDDQDVEDRWEARGRKLLMHRPQVMFSAILGLLRDEKCLLLDKDGTLSTLSEPCEEEEKELA